MLGIGIEPPQVVQLTEISLAVETFAAVDPELAAFVGPAGSGISTAGNVRRSGGAKSPVDSRLATGSGGAARAAGRYGAASPHPRPLLGGRVELPEIIQVASILVRIESGAAEKPEIAVAVTPVRCQISTARDVCGGRGAEGPVDPRLPTGNRVAACAAGRYGAASPHPRPLLRGGLELPQVIQLTEVSVGIDALAPEKPEIAAAVGPSRRAVSGAGNVARRGRS